MKAASQVITVLLVKAKDSICPLVDTAVEWVSLEDKEKAAEMGDKMGTILTWVCVVFNTLLPSNSKVLGLPFPCFLFVVKMHRNVYKQ